MDIVLLTVETTGYQSAQGYADDFYEDNGYGQGSSNSGILFLLAMEEREWYISTCGKVIYAVTDYGIQQLGESVVPYLSAGRWYEGFAEFLASLPSFLDACEQGAPVDGYADYSGDYYHGDREEAVYYEETAPSFLLSLLAGLAAAGISIAVMRASMNSKRPQRSAGDYLQKDSWNLYQHRDLFLYSNVTKTRRQEPKPSSGGGSSVHRSSGGRRHGGGGGKF